MCPEFAVTSAVLLFCGSCEGSDRVQLGFQRRAQSVCDKLSLSLFSSEAQCFLPSMPIYGPLQTITQISVWIFIWLYWCLLYNDLSFHPFGFCKMPFPSKWCRMTNVMRVWTLRRPVIALCKYIPAFSFHVQIIYSVYFKVCVHGLYLFWFYFLPFFSALWFYCSYSLNDFMLGGKYTNKLFTEHVDVLLLLGQSIKFYGL